jgi:hypothetical protein
MCRNSPERRTTLKRQMNPLARQSAAAQFVDL